MRLFAGCIFFLTVFLLMTGSALAIIGGDGIDPNSPDSPWAGVGSITIKGGGTYSGALISRRHVLTAAHVVHGHEASPGDITFNINYGGNLTYRLTASAVYLFPKYRGTQPGRDGLWHDDIAIIELSSPVPAAVPIYPLYQGIPGVTGNSRDITFVGYGAGDDATHSRQLPPDPQIKRVGRNKVDLLVRNPGDETGFDLFLYRFISTGRNLDEHGKGDSSTPSLSPDAIFSGGDSGSPVFIQDNGTWKIAGIATFATAQANDHSSFSAMSALGGGTLVAPFVGWINDKTTQPQRPDNSVALTIWIGALLVTGLGLGLAYRYFRRRPLP